MFPDLQERLGNAPSAMASEYPSFTDWPTPKAHPVPPALPKWTLEQLMYNVPTPWSGSRLPAGSSVVRDDSVVRVSGSSSGNTTMFAQVFEASTTRRLTRIDLWLRLSAAALPHMPYISYFIVPVKADGSPDVDNPLQCAMLRPKDRKGGKWVKCGVSAKELPVVPVLASGDIGSAPAVEWQPMKLYFDPEEAQLVSGKKYALVLSDCPLDTCWLSTNDSPSSRLDLSTSTAAATQRQKAGTTTTASTSYEIAVHKSNGVAGAMVFTGGAWKALPDTAAASVFYEPGSTRLGYQPNQLHKDWVAFHANTTANEVKEMAAIAKKTPSLNSTNGKTLDVVVVSRNDEFCMKNEELCI